MPGHPLQVAISGASVAVGAVDGDQLSFVAVGREQVEEVLLRPAGFREDHGLARCTEHSGMLECGLEGRYMSLALGVVLNRVSQISIATQLVQLILEHCGIDVAQ